LHTAEKLEIKRCFEYLLFKSRKVSGHDFSRAVNATKHSLALAPEGSFFYEFISFAGICKSTYLWRIPLEATLSAPAQPHPQDLSNQPARLEPHSSLFIQREARLTVVFVLFDL
jgi:hypothetical protein